MIFIIVATCIAEAEDIQKLELCIHAIFSQSPLPQALWVSWFAESFGHASHAAQELEALSASCFQQGISLVWFEQKSKLHFWEHVRDVLVKQQDVGTSAGAMWVQLVHVDVHPCLDRSNELAAAASAASKASRFVWAPGVSSSGFALSGVLVKMPALADFFASTPNAILAHDLCDIAFLSFANAEPSLLASLALRVALAAQPGDDDHRRATKARERAPKSPTRTPQSHPSPPPSPERQASMAVVPGHVARLTSSYQGGMALPVGEDLARCLAACRRGGAALAMAALHGPSGGTAGAAEHGLTDADVTSLAEGVGRSFGLGPAGRRWVEEAVRELAQEARGLFGPVLQPHDGAW